MKLLSRTLVDLSSKNTGNLTGHISVYKMDNGNLYYVYFIEARYYASKEIDPITKKIIKERGSISNYHYSVDLFFYDKARHLGWPGKVSHTALIRSLTRQKIRISNDVKEII